MPVSHRVGKTQSVEKNGVLNERRFSLHEERKKTPVYSGVLSYFPLALKEISRVSLAGNEQHHPGSPLHWDKNKSTDHLDALVRHLLDHASGELIDKDGVRHLAKVAWRSLAALQIALEGIQKSTHTSA